MGKAKYVQWGIFQSVQCAANDASRGTKPGDDIVVPTKDAMVSNNFDWCTFK